MNFIARALSLLMLVGGIFILPWFFVFGFFAYFAVIFPWFLEALLAALALDALGGLPFGFFMVIFMALIIFVECLKPIFHARLSGAYGAALTAFFALMLAYTAYSLFVYWGGAADSLAFWREIGRGFLYGLAALVLSSVAHRIINNVRHKKDFIQ